MKKLSLLAVVLIAVAGCGKPLPTEEELLKNHKLPDSAPAVIAEAKNKNYASRYVWIDKPRVRQKAGPDGPAIALLVLNEEVYLTGKKSDSTSRITLHCVEHDAPWVEIIRKDGTKGWVYGGALKEAPVDKPEVLRSIIAYFPSAAPNELQNQDLTLISNACVSGKIFYTLTLNKRCAPIGNSPTPFSSVDPTKYIPENNLNKNGFLFVQEGIVPEYQPFAPANLILKKASLYFGKELK